MRLTNGGPSGCWTFAELYFRDRRLFRVYMASAILLEAGLSFLGLGVQPAAPSWGIMVSTGRTYLLEAEHIATFAGLVIAVAVLGFNLMSGGFRDVWDTKLSP